MFAAGVDEPGDIDYHQVRRLLLVDATLVVDLYQLEPDHQSVDANEHNRAQAYLRSCS